MNNRRRELDISGSSGALATINGRNLCHPEAKKRGKVKSHTRAGNQNWTMLERKDCEPIGEQGPVAQTSVEDEELWKGSV